MKSNVFDKISFVSLFLVVVLLPIFFLPFTNFPVEVTKGLLLVVGLSICVFFWAIARFSDGKISLPKSWCLVSGAGVILVFFLSALFSKASQMSFFGLMFDVGSFWFIFAGFLLMFYSSVVFRDSKKARAVLLGIILSSAVVLIFQIFRFFMPETLSLGVLIKNDRTSNIFGSWNAFGLFAGFSGLTSLLVIEFFPVIKIVKWILRILILISMALIAVVNFSFVWILLGISSLIIFVYKVSITSKGKNEEGRSYFPTFSFIIVIISLLFLISGQSVREILPKRLGLVSNEVSQSFKSTISVTKLVLAKNPVLGIGPNKFAEAWAMYKPVSVNATMFWNTLFDSGSGLLPTLASTTGYLGILALFSFFVFFLIAGVKSVFFSIKNSANWEVVAFFMLSFYLFVSSFFYSHGLVIFLLALAFAGMFLGLFASSRSNGEILISFLGDHKKSFFSILILVLLMIASVATLFKYTERFISVSYFRKALLTASTLPVAESSINKALALYSNDLYLRTYAQVHLAKLDYLIKKETSLSDTEKAELQTNFDQAVKGMQLAVTFNPRNYLNFEAFGSLYQAVGSFGTKNVYNKAIEAYKLASALNPLNPGIKLEIANSFFADGNLKEARNYANEALTLKEDYIDALVTLSQIAKSEGSKEEAISYAEKALSFSPLNKDLTQYLDSLKSSNLSNSNATNATNTTNVPTDKSKQENKQIKKQ